MITKILNESLNRTGEQRNYWYAKDEQPHGNENNELEKHLISKYKKYIGEKWYGFSFGSPTPPEWFNIIEKFLDYLIDLQNQNKISNFKIHQIKMKFGGLRFYIAYKCDDEELDEFIKLQINKLENWLFDERLIY